VCVTSPSAFGIIVASALLFRSRTAGTHWHGYTKTGESLMLRLSRIAYLVTVLGACARDATSPNGALPRSTTLSRGGSDVGAVFTLSNSAAGNAVIAFGRSADGSLSPAGSFATLGKGTGAGLG
jgi:hypothetical protein